jgi:hypothetical protein
MEMDVGMMPVWRVFAELGTSGKPYKLEARGEDVKISVDPLG